MSKRIDNLEELLNKDLDERTKEELIKIKEEILNEVYRNIIKTKNNKYNR